MVAKESVRTRFERPDQGISYTEFSYMLLQAYDFLRLHVDHGCDLQIGGSDQWGNITMGIELIRKVCRDEVWGLTTPLIAQAGRDQVRQDRDGHRVARPGPHEPVRHVPVLHQHRRRASGGTYLRYLTFLDHEEIDAPRRGDAGAPPERARPRGPWPGPWSLSCTDDGEVAKCEEASAALFTEEIAGLTEEMLLAVTEDAPTSRPRADALERRPDAGGRAGGQAWPRQSRRPPDHRQGGAYVNNVRQTDRGAHTRPGRPVA